MTLGARAGDAATAHADAEARLVQRARGGDRGAFAELHARYRPVVHALLITRLPVSEVADAVQEVFLRALGALAALEGGARFGPWLCAIARNAARDLHRVRRRPEVLPAELPERAPALDPGEREEAARALAALRGLPEAYRETLALRLVEGLSGPEIAARTGLTHGSVRVNLCRGMKLLRESLGEVQP